MSEGYSPDTRANPPVDTDGLVAFGQTHNRKHTQKRLWGVPGELINKHALVSGPTGSGKTTTLTWTVYSAHLTTDGPTILFDRKGDGWPERICRTLVTVDSSLEDVYYFDSTAGVPSLSILDLRPYLDAGLTRFDAVTHVIETVQTLLAVHLPDDDAVRAPDVLEHLLWLLYDPIEGDNVTSLDAIHDAVVAWRDSGAFPEATPEWLDRLRQSAIGVDPQTREVIAQGLLTRIEKLYQDARLRPLFQTLPEDDDQVFQFDDWLDRDVVMLFDLGALSDEGQRVLANALLYALWGGLKRTTQSPESTSIADRMTLIIDEAPQLHVGQRLTTFLSQARSFGLGVVLAMQYPRQFLETDSEAVYREILEDVHTVVLGRLSNDSYFANRLSNASRSSAEIENRLGSLADDEFLAKPASEFGKQAPPVDMIQNPPLPPGHPDGRWPLMESDEVSLDSKIESCRERATACMRSYDQFTSEAYAEYKLEGEDRKLHTALEAIDGEHTLPLLESVPDPLVYEPETGVLWCSVCSSPVSIEADAIAAELQRCGPSVDGIDPGLIPPLALGISTNPSMILELPITLRQYCGLQVVANMWEHRYDPIEFDPVFDSAKHALESLGFTRDDFETLIDGGYLTRQEINPNVYYSVTSAGRELLGVDHTEEERWGAGLGDLNESLAHRVLVEAGVRYLRARMYEGGDGSDQNSTITQVIPYYEPDTETRRRYGLAKNVRFDAVGVDGDGEITAILEAERSNNDRRTAAIQDFDQIAKVDPAHAVWIVPSRRVGHEAVLGPLADPPRSPELSHYEPRVKSRSSSTRLADITGIDEPGMTEIHTLSGIRKHLVSPEDRL